MGHILLFHCIREHTCELNNKKIGKHIEQNFHSFARFMPPDGTGGVKNFSVGICDGAPSTARSSL